MSVPTWPITLPQDLLIAGYGESPGDNQLRSNMDVGPAKVRRRSTAAPRKVKGGVILTREQLVTFREFYDDILLSGTLRFSWHDPTKPESAVEMRFTEVPSWTAESGQFNLSLSLEILP